MEAQMLERIADALDRRNEQHDADVARALALREESITRADRNRAEDIVIARSINDEALKKFDEVMAEMRALRDAVRGMGMRVAALESAQSVDAVDPDAPSQHGLSTREKGSDVCPDCHRLREALEEIADEADTLSQAVHMAYEALLAASSPAAFTTEVLSQPGEAIHRERLTASDYVQRALEASPAAPQEADPDVCRCGHANGSHGIVQGLSGNWLRPCNQCRCGEYVPAARVAAAPSPQEPKA